MSKLDDWIHPVSLSPDIDADETIEFDPKKQI